MTVNKRFISAWARNRSIRIRITDGATRAWQDDPRTVDELINEIYSTRTTPSQDLQL
jgi:hypothetical protein